MQGLRLKRTNSDHYYIYIFKFLVKHHEIPRDNYVSRYLQQNRYIITVLGQIHYYNYLDQVIRAVNWRIFVLLEDSRW